MMMMMMMVVLLMMMMMTLLADDFFRIPLTFLVIAFLSSLGGVGSSSVSVGASESLSVNESSVLTILIGDFFGLICLPLPRPLPERSLLSSLPLFLSSTLSLPYFSQHMSLL